MYRSVGAVGTVIDAAMATRFVRSVSRVAPMFTSVRLTLAYVPKGHSLIVSGMVGAELCDRGLKDGRSTSMGSRRSRFLSCAMVLLFAVAGLLPADPTLAQSAESAGVLPRSGELRLADLVAGVRASGKAVRSRRIEREIAQAGIERAESAFQPQAQMSAIDGRQRLKNTPEEEITRRGLGLYDRRAQDYSLSVSQLMEFGTRVEAKASLSKFITNITRDVRQSDDEDFRAFYGFTVTQPLARDSGRAAPLARVRLAELDARAAEFATGDTEASAVAEAAFAYWDLLLAQERERSAIDKVRMGERLLLEAQALNRNGRLPQAEVWEVENNLGRFEASLSESRQGVQERVSRLRTLLMTHSGEAGPGLRAVDRLPAIAEQVIGFDQALRVALERRDDYLMRKVMVEREGLQIAYAQNQELPKIDLVASYGLNGLELTAGRAFAYTRMNDYPSWTVGLQMAMPIGENRQARADLRSATLRKEDALLQLKALEVSVSNDIDTAIAMLSSATERWRLWVQVAEREERQLQLERSRLAAGRSDMREILLREERAIVARLQVTEQHVAWVKAETLLNAAQGLLLERFR